MSGLQKHERQAVDAIRAEAAKHGVTAQVLRDGKGRHGVKVLLSTATGFAKVSISCSPKNAENGLRGAVRETRQHCLRLTGGKPSAAP